MSLEEEKNKRFKIEMPKYFDLLEISKNIFFVKEHVYK